MGLFWLLRELIYARGWEEELDFAICLSWCSLYTFAPAGWFWGVSWNIILFPQAQWWIGMNGFGTWSVTSQGDSSLEFFCNWLERSCLFGIADPGPFFVFAGRDAGCKAGTHGLHAWLLPLLSLDLWKHNKSPQYALLTRELTLHQAVSERVPSPWQRIGKLDCAWLVNYLTPTGWWWWEPVVAPRHLVQ